MKLLYGLALAAPLWAQAGLPPELLLLTRVKRHMAEVLRNMPNYTCLETMQRFRRDRPGESRKPADTVRFEVAQIGGHELYAWPGEPVFEERDPAAFAGTGMISTGLFTAHAKSVFVDDMARFHFAGRESLQGRRAVRYDYRISLMDSGYSIALGSASGRVATKGSFWVDPATLDVLRLEVDADEIPPDIAVQQAVTRIDYARTRVGAADVLLPQSGDLTMEMISGRESYNRVEFTHCQAYGSESTLSFAAPPESAPTLLGMLHPGREAGMELPGGLPLSLRLLTALDSRSVTPGMPIEAQIASDVKLKGRVLVPAGAKVQGRLRRVEPSSVLALEFVRIIFAGGNARFFADLEQVDKVPGLRQEPARPETDLPGVGNFALDSPSFQVPAGFTMLWRTRALRAPR